MPCSGRRPWGSCSSAPNSTVAEVADRWLKALKPNVGAKTYNRYEGIVRDYIKPTLGAVRLSKLTPLHIEDALTKWRSATPKNRKSATLKQRSIHHIFATLKSLLARAKRWNLTSRNVCESVNAPSKGRSEVLALDETTALTLLSGLRDTSLAVPVHIALLTGLRRGELLALCWEDIDLDRRVANVHRALEQLKGGACGFKDTKTKKSRRPVPLTSEAIDVLKAHRAQQNAVRLQSPGYNPEGLVFAEPATGMPWGPDRFSSVFYYRAHKLGIPITFHGLRHSFATIALRARVPMKLVSDILGHTTTAVTADLYTHVLEDMQHEAADRVGEAFAAARKRAL